MFPSKCDIKYDGKLCRVYKRLKGLIANIQNSLRAHKQDEHLFALKK